MDWIERRFHVAPDGGNGTLEVGILAGAAVTLVLMPGSACAYTLPRKHMGQ